MVAESGSTIEPRRPRAEAIRYRIHRTGLGGRFTHVSGKGIGRVALRSQTTLPRVVTSGIRSTILRVSSLNESRG